MKMTKLMSTVAVIALLGGSTLSAASGETKDGYHDGQSNTWVGANALLSIEEGTGNVAFGKNAGSSVVDGSNNTYVGIASGGQSTGSSNVFLGSAAGFNETGSDKLFIANSETESPLIYGEFDNKMLQVNGIMDINASSFDPNPDWNHYHALTLYAGDVDPKKMAWGFWLEANIIGDGALVITNAATGKKPIVIANTADNCLLGLANNRVTMNLPDVILAPENKATLAVGGGIFATLDPDDTSSFHRLLTLDMNNTGAGNSNVGFSLVDSEADYEWTFRTNAASKGFSASQVGTGGNEFEVQNTGSDLTTTVVKMGGVVIFENGSLVDGTGAPLASLVQEQSIKLAAMEAGLEAKDAEIIAMKANQEAQNIEIAQLKTMQQKVAMMESILTNLALNTSDTDKTKVSVNLK